MTGRLISDEFERLDLLLENKRILQEKYEFTVKRLKALENLCLQMGKVPTVENGFVLLLTGQGDLRRAMMQKKMVCGKLVEKFGDYQALREEVFDYSTNITITNSKKIFTKQSSFAESGFLGGKSCFIFQKLCLWTRC